MWALIGLFIGAVAGNFIGHDWGAVLGGLAGFFIGAVFAGSRQRATFRKPDGATSSTPMPVRPEMRSVAHDGELLHRIAALEQRVAGLEHAARSVTGALIAGDARSASSAPITPTELAATAPVARATTPPGDVWIPGADRTLQPGPAAMGGTASDAQATVPPAIPVAPAALANPPMGTQAAPSPNLLRAWFAGGNALTRIGVVVLFFGVAFLLKYFAEHFTVPIEAKLLGVAIAGAALIGLGVKTAAARPSYGLSLQGAGAGVLYLTAYAAFRLYDVLPDGIAIALLVAISILTVWLAVRSDSQALAGLAIAGGFIAPMLSASDGGPALIFGYFVVLNGAIFTLAWVRAWRALNVVGFVFTFALGIVWGHQYYVPSQYAVVQPFLVVFFAFYLAIAILYARRGPLAAKNPVDGLLVFGVPLVGYALQAALVRDERYGAAWSALALCVVYAALFLALRKREAPGFALLSRAFLALAVIFATIAVPLALDNRATAAVWAIEAAGVYWIGVRQRSTLSRAFALAIELGAGIVFALSGTAGEDDQLFANAFFAGAVLIALSGLATAFFADRARDELPVPERGLVALIFAWGIAWWVGAGGFELVRQLSPAEASHATLAWVVLGVALALALRRRVHWPRLAAAGIALLPTMAFAAFGDFERARTTLAAYGWLVWPVAWTVQWRVLRAAERLRFADVDEPAQSAGPRGAAGFLNAVHAVSAFALTTQLAWEASEWAGRITPGHTVWVACAAALPAIAYVAVVTRWRRDARWPFADYGDAYAVSAGAPIAASLALWFAAVNLLSPGDSSPLPYAPVANPLDVTLVLALVALFAWAQRCSTLSERMRYSGLGALLFVALNGVVLRTAHHWADIPWRLPALLASKPLQAALTLTWTATALALMFAATRRRLRPLWMVGAGLLAVVVGKLFLVDLGALSGLPRVVAFLGVGALLLVIGYLSPLPPSAREEEGAPPRS